MYRAQIEKKTGGDRNARSEKHFLVFIVHKSLTYVKTIENRTGTGKSIGTDVPPSAHTSFWCVLKIFISQGMVGLLFVFFSSLLYVYPDNPRRQFRFGRGPEYVIIDRQLMTWRRLHGRYTASRRGKSIADDWQADERWKTQISHEQ